MKRWMSLLVLVLLLSGCADADPSQLNTTQPTLEQPRQPLTVCALPENDCTAVKAMGDKLLACCGDQLMLLEPETMECTASVSIVNLDPDGLQIGDNGVSYYDKDSRTVYFMDSSLQKRSSLQLLPETRGDVRLTDDWEKLYYCTEQGIRVLELETGISRVLCSKEENWQGVSGVVMGGTMLQVSAVDDGAVTTLLLSTQTGEILWQSGEDNTLTCCGELYFYTQPDETGRELIYGWGSRQPRNFWLGEEEMLFLLPESSTAVTLTDSGTLRCYDLPTGLCVSEAAQTDITDIRSATRLGDCVYFLCQGTLYCWDLTVEPLEDSTLYMSYRYTLEDPDEEGMEKIEKQASIAGESYGLNLILWNDVTAVAPEGYSFTVEYIPENYAAALSTLKTALAHFPRTMMMRVADWTESGKLNIVLVRDFSSDTPVGDGATGAMQYLLNGDVYIVLALTEQIDQSFYHALGHVIDIAVMSNTTVFYEWNDLNPKKFKYDNDYITNLDRTDTKYIQGSSRYFIDTYSMSFPVEDRAQILEYAMMSGNEEYFESKYMQVKLRRVCNGIREAFGLKGDSYIWEQYLK